jgi:DNA-dependent protein kinase catalytic subunit
MNPTTVLMNEIEVTKHSKADYASNLEGIVRGDETRVRRAMREGYLPLAD